MRQPKDDNPLSIKNYLIIMLVPTSILAICIGLIAHFIIGR